MFKRTFALESEENKQQEKGSSSMNTSPEIQNHITQSVELIKLLEVLYRRKNTARGLDTPWFGARLLLTRMKESLSYVMGDIEKILSTAWTWAP